MDYFRPLRSRILLALTLSGLGASAASADFYLHPWESHHEKPKRFTLAPTLRLYSSDTNFAPDGTTYLPWNLDRYSRMQLDTEGSYGFDARISAWGRLSWCRVSVSSGGTSGSTFGLCDSSFALNYRLVHRPGDDDRSGFWLDLQAQADLAPYSNEISLTGTLTPFLGNSTNDFGGGAFLGLPLSNDQEAMWSLVAGGGYVKRSRPFADAFQWSAFTAYEPKVQGLGFKAGAYGFHTLEADPLKNASLATLNPLGSGGSFATGSTHPTIINLKFDLTYQLDRQLALTGGYQMPVAGNAAPQGWTASGGVVLHFGDDRKPHQKSPREYGKANRGFIDYAFEAKVLRVNDAGDRLKIDKGSQDGVEVGQVFDLFPTKSGEIGEAVARARVQSVKADEAILQIRETWREVLVEEGFVAKRPLQ
jgi:hypothetical protein